MMFYRLKRNSPRREEWWQYPSSASNESQESMRQSNAIGFVGLGVMGEPICRNLLKKSGRPIVAFDLVTEPLARVRADGATMAESIGQVMQAGDVMFFCLPSGKH